MIGRNLMDPLPPGIIPRHVMTKNGFLARVVPQAVRLHRREINPHRVLVTARRGPVVLPRASVLERAAL